MIADVEQVRQCRELELTVIESKKNTCTAATWILFRVRAKVPEVHFLGRCGALFYMPRLFLRHLWCCAGELGPRLDSTRRELYRQIGRDLVRHISHQSSESTLPSGASLPLANSFTLILTPLFFLRNNYRTAQCSYWRILTSAIIHPSLAVTGVYRAC
jgi:hypothetical protein